MEMRRDGAKVPRVRLVRLTEEDIRRHTGGVAAPVSSREERVTDAAMEGRDGAKRPRLQLMRLTEEDIRRYATPATAAESAREERVTKQAHLRTNNAQMTALIDHMSRHRNFAASRLIGGKGKENLQSFWADLTKNLNMLGPSKTLLSWKKVWSDAKVRARKKAAQRMQALQRTGNNTTPLVLAPSDEIILSIIGEQSALGLPVPSSVPDMNDDQLLIVMGLEEGHEEIAVDAENSAENNVPTPTFLSPSQNETPAIVNVHEAFQAESEPQQEYANTSGSNTTLNAENNLLWHRRPLHVAPPSRWSTQVDQAQMVKIIETQNNLIISVLEGQNKIYLSTDTLNDRTTPSTFAAPLFLQ